MGRRGQLKYMKSRTDREREIILTLAEGGLSNRDVGRQLSLSEGTVNAHLHNIYKKLGVNKTDCLGCDGAHSRREELLPLGESVAQDDAPDRTGRPFEAAHCEEAPPPMC
jgi:DNA-binding CsgD family transcriptional regulator